MCEQGKATNELNYWKDCPEILADKKVLLLPEMEKEYNDWKELKATYFKLKEESARLVAIVKENQFKLFGEGARIRRENADALFRLKKDLALVEKEYNAKKDRVPILEEMINLLHSL